MRSLSDNAAWLTMPDAEREVLVSLCWRANTSTGECPVGSEAAIRAQSRNPRSITRILKTLEAEGWIKTMPAGFNTTTLFVNTSRVLQEGAAAQQAYFFKGVPKSPPARRSRDVPKPDFETWVKRFQAAAAAVTEAEVAILRAERRLRRPMPTHEVADLQNSYTQAKAELEERIRLLQAVKDAFPE